MRLILLRFAGLAGATACGLMAVAAGAAADPYFSFFETSDSKPAFHAALADVLGVADAAPAQEELRPARAEQVEPPGAWTTVVVRDDVKSSSARANAAASAGRAPGNGQTGHPLAGPRLTGTGHSLNGIASYYWQDQMTATGERFNKRELTAAHRTLPFGTRVRVTRLDTGSSVIVRINDRGPFKPGRVIDLSERAAEDIGMTGAGLTNVSLEVLGR